jgi:hypothetical protein
VALGIVALASLALLRSCRLVRGVGFFTFAGIGSPLGILRWYRRLLAKKYDGSKARKAGLDNELIAKSNDEPNMDPGRQ